MPNYSVDGLKAGIDNCRKNIQVFEDAIRKEKETIQEYSFYISEILKKEKAAKEETKKAAQSNP
jgi:hypothetical protein